MELVVRPLDRVLQVPPGANLLETLRAHEVAIRTAYTTLIRDCHPDVSRSRVS